MNALRRIEGKRASLTELEGPCGMTRSQVRHAVLRLGEMGLVVIEDDPGTRSTMVRVRDEVDEEKKLGHYVGGKYVGKGQVSSLTKRVLESQEAVGSVAILHHLCGSKKRGDFLLY